MKRVKVMETGPTTTTTTTPNPVWHQCIQQRFERDGIAPSVSEQEIMACKDPYTLLALLNGFWYGASTTSTTTSQPESIRREEQFVFTTLGKCSKCGKQQARCDEKQIRSSDEPATQFIECICGHKWRRN